MKNSTKKKIIGYLIDIIILMIFCLCTLIVLHKLDDMQNYLDYCKSIGYKGITFISRYSPEYVCAN